MDLPDRCQALKSTLGRIGLFGGRTCRAAALNLAYICAVWTRRTAAELLNRPWGVLNSLVAGLVVSPVRRSKQKNKKLQIKEEEIPMFPENARAFHRKVENLRRFFSHFLSRTNSPLFGWKRILKPLENLGTSCVRHVSRIGRARF